jgi:hypothetical protein
MALDKISAQIKIILGDRNGFLSFGELISQKIVWSSLAKIGQSWPAKLTILVPFLGYLLLFNENTEMIFRFSDFFLKDIGVDSVTEPSKFATKNLYLTYFGACAFGVGSILFSMFCPYEVKRYDGIMDYVDNVQLDNTPVLAKSNLQTVLDGYFSMEREDGGSVIKSSEYPHDLESDFYNLISEMFQDTERSDVDPLSNDAVDSNTNSQLAEYESASAEGDKDDGSMHDFYSSLYSGSGYPNIEEIARLVWSSPKVVWAFTQPFRSLSPKYAKDIAFVKYKGLNYQNFKTRILIMLFYTIGFILLSIPTIITFWRLLKGIW